MTDSGALSRFSPATRQWFESAFSGPTPAQLGGWDAISSGNDALVVAPTGSGKTLAAFLWALDGLATAEPVPELERLRVLYVSPLKALAADIERNLRSPLAGIRAAAERAGSTPFDISVGVRTGDTPADERRRFVTRPPDVLITTPESLFLLLTSRARDAMRHIDTVIVDEVHAVAGTKRGAHLAVSLERLDRIIGRRAQRIGLSATVRPVEEIARWLTGTQTTARVVNPPSDKVFELKIVVPVEDMNEPGDPTDELTEGSAAGAVARTSVWPHVESRLWELIKAHTSTIVFANSRRLAERLCARLNELEDEATDGASRMIARAHHGSVSREQRVAIEEDLKSGRLPAVVATSSLELGIDMADVDLVVQVEAPDSVASGLQRIGRAGHQVGAVSRGVFFPKYRGDLLECAVVSERMQVGAIEETHYPKNPLDVLAQHIVAMVAMDAWTVDELDDLVRRAAPFSELPRSALEATLDMLAGRYPSDEFSEFRARLEWDRAGGVLTARRGAQRLAVTSGGTIPDRGLFGVFLGREGGTRVGELDEEMVYESRVGEVFVLGATSWLIEDITYDRVIVSPAPGQSGKMPFWHGDAPGRPIELGRAQGAFMREISHADDEARSARLRAAGLDDLAVSNLVRFLAEQKEAVGTLHDDKTIVVERFRDEIGDWRVCIHSCFGSKVHAPWAQAIEARVRERLGIEVQTMYTDDGIVVRIPEADEAPPGDSVVFEPEELDDLIVSQVANSSLFAGRFRECAARALLLPKRRPGSRQPLWQQRQKSASLLQAAGRYPSFPVVLETYRECLQDVFDVPALKELMGQIARREVRVVEVDSAYPSPFASSLTFGFISAFMYEGDAPVAERRAQALSLDRKLLSELLGRDELRELIDESSLTELELELQLLAEDRKVRDAEELQDAFRRIGDLTLAEVQARAAVPGAAEGWIEELAHSRRIVPVRVAGRDGWIAIEDAARVRDALGVALPVGLPAAFLEPVSDPIGDLVGRWARTHGPFGAGDVAARFGLGVAVVEGALGRLESQGRVFRGEFHPAGRPGTTEWIDAEVLRRLRRRSLAAFRKEIEPAPPEALARFALEWHGITYQSGARSRSGDLDLLYKVVEQLQGVPLPASQLESLILPARIPGYSPSLLDQLCASGEVVWAGAGATGRDDGWICLATAGGAATVLSDPPTVELSPLAERALKALETRGAMFFRGLSEEVGSLDDRELLAALWELVWGGIATNDTLAPLRGLAGSTATPRPSGRRRAPAFPARMGPPAAQGRWSTVGAPEASDTKRRHALAEQLLRRHGIVTRATVMSEHLSGGFTGVYPVLRAMEESGRVRRGYFVEGLGGAQFALPGAVDRMRASVTNGATQIAHVMAASDPAMLYGAALPWPDRPETGHRPARKAGAGVALVDAVPAVYIEKGGRSLLTLTDDEDVVAVALGAIGRAARRGRLGVLHIQVVDGESVLGTSSAATLVEAGGRTTSRGVRFRPEIGA
jgi:ATP-dependent helicase Lhr and Lhr-like helicase